MCVWPETSGIKRPTSCAVGQPRGAEMRFPKRGMAACELCSLEFWESRKPRADPRLPPGICLSSRTSTVGQALLLLGFSSNLAVADYISYLSPPSPFLTITKPTICPPCLLPVARFGALPTRQSVEARCPTSTSTAPLVLIFLALSRTPHSDRAM